MKILVLNLILRSPQEGVILPRPNNHDAIAYTLCRAMAHMGHDVTLVASEEYKPTSHESNTFETIFFPSRLPGIFKPWLLPYPKGLGKWLRKNASSYDRIISSELFSIASLMACIHSKQEIIIWQEICAYHKMMYGIPDLIWHKIIAPVFMRNVRVKARSESAKNFISKHIANVAPYIVDHGTDSEIFHPSEEHENAFIVVSSLLKLKRVDRIIKKFSQFVKTNGFNDYKLHIVGDGPERESLKQYAVELSVADNIIFHGFLQHSQFAGLLRRCTAMLVDTAWDLNMVSIPEAITSGTPLVMNTVPLSATFVRENGLGIVKEEWNHTDLEQAHLNYERSHRACVSMSEKLSARESARKLLL